MEAADNNIYTVTAAVDTQNSVRDVGRSVRVATPIGETRTGRRRRAGAFFTIVLRAVRLPISVAKQPSPHRHSTRAQPPFRGRRENVKTSIDSNSVQVTCTQTHTHTYTHTGTTK